MWLPEAGAILPGVAVIMPAAGTLLLDRGEHADAIRTALTTMSTSDPGIVPLSRMGLVGSGIYSHPPKACQRRITGDHIGNLAYVPLASRGCNAF
jgi:hypothetical protein